MNNYARVPDMLPDLNAAGVTVGLDRIAEAIAEASWAARTMTGGRQFHCTVETAHFSGAGCRELWLERDLISITTLKVADTADQPATFENTLAANTDYTLWPRNAAAQGKPYRKIILNPAGQYSAFPKGVDNVQLAGVFGYSAIWNAVVISGAQITGTLSSTTDLTLVVSAAPAADEIAVGDTLQLGSEQMGPVLSVAGTTVTLQARGINGTTAASHSGVAVYLRRYPDDIERAVRADAARYLWRAAQGMPEGGFREMWPAIAMTLQSYGDPGAVI